MQEEIFRFSIVRNPQRISAEKLKTSVVHLIDGGDRNYKAYPRLKRSKNGGASRERLIEIAKAETAEKTFLKSPSQLKTKVVSFGEWLIGQKKLEGEKVKKQAESIFGKPLSNFTKSKPFKDDKFIVSDSLVVASIVKPKQNSLRGELMKIRRTVFLLEKVAEADNNFLDTKILNKFLKATITLPCDLFPISHKNEELRTRNVEARKTRIEAVEESKTRINDAIGKLKDNNDAIKELTNSYSNYLFKAKNKSKDSSASDKHSSLAFLKFSTEELKNLSETTKEVIKKVGVSEDTVDVVYAVKTLEAQNIPLAEQASQSIQDVVANNPNANVAVLSKSCGACKVVITEELKPENNFTGQTKGKVNQMGLQDLMIVRQNLLKYESGEIAHIENVLKGESKSKEHRKLNRVEETVFEETETETETEEELQTTDRFELQSETSNTIKEDTSKEAGVKATASYGTVKIEAHGNYSSDTATEDSRNSSSNYAKDVVSRSLQRVKERVLKRRSRTDISEVEIINKHGMDNTTGGDHITGIYRWVNKLYEAQVVNYGKRTMLEFMVPEPAAFYRFALSNSPENEINVEKPDEPGFCQAGRFIKLKPTDLTVHNYMCFVGKYGVSDVKPPPREFREKYLNGKAYSEESDNKNTEIQFTDKEVKIPKNYQVEFVKYRIEVGISHVKATKARDEVFLSVLLGNKPIFQKDFQEWDTEHNSDNYNGKYVFLEEDEQPLNMVGNIESLSVSIAGFSTVSTSVNFGIRVFCKRTPEACKEWQIETYNAIMNAYKVLKLEYDEALESQQFDTSISIQGQNPFINREVEKTELKKHSISILTGQQYEGFNAMWQDHRQGFGYPEIDLKDAAEEGDFVQFFEQALEWRHITYIFYDYFWGRKHNWIDTLNIKDTDPLFEKFLKAGYARVWVPIRPSFVSALLHYINCGGEPWTEKDAPVCCVDGVEQGFEQPPTLSIIEEMKEQLNNDFVEREGTITVTDGEKKVTGENTDFSIDDVDREILINLESYRIAKFVSPTEITLREAYKGEDDEKIGVSIGVKYVGEPWVVQVPTSLVFLGNDDLELLN